MFNHSVFSNYKWTLSWVALILKRAKYFLMYWTLLEML